MTKKATIATLNEKHNNLESLYNGLLATVNQKFSTLRNRVGGLLGMSHDGKRNIYDIYGYPETLDGDAGFVMMKAQSGREGIANRITHGMAKSCWRDGFEVFESTEDDAEPVLVDEINALQKSKFYQYLERADILNRIGRCSVLFVGVPDGADNPSEPLGKVTGGADMLDKLYFVPYAYDGITVGSQVSDVSDPRFGLPLTYTLQRRGTTTGKDTEVKAITAHYSRVILMNENGLESDIEGMGAMEPVFNRILDLDKTCGGSAEAYFRNAKGKIGITVDKEFTAALTDKTTKDALQEGAEKFTNQWQDHLYTVGGQIAGIDTPHASPLDTVRVSLWVISGYTGIPMRILTGEGSGQLAGSEDQLAYNQLVNDRQHGPCLGWVVDLLEMLENAGMLKLPETYDIRFPPQDAATESQQVEIDNKKATTFNTIMQGASTMAGSGAKVTDALAAVGLSDIDYEEVDLEEIDDDLEDDDIDDPEEKPEAGGDDE